MDLVRNERTKLTATYGAQVMSAGQFLSLMFMPIGGVLIGLLMLADKGAAPRYH